MAPGGTRQPRRPHTAPDWLRWPRQHQTAPDESKPNQTALAGAAEGSVHLLLLVFETGLSNKSLTLSEPRWDWEGSE